MKNRGMKESKITKCIKAPIRALGKARDFYVKSMNNLAAGQISHVGSRHSSTFSKSFSVNSSLSTTKDDDFRELLRVASIRKLDLSKIETEFLRRQNSRLSSFTFAEPTRVVPRSQSVAFGRIDEDCECDFRDEDINKTSADLFARSKSYAVTAYRNKY